MSKQVNFNLDEETEMQFQLSIKGSSSLPNVKPLIRFIISEANESGVSVAIPATATNEGASVTIPPMKQIFSEDKEYIGKLEIIVGNRYFAPISMNIGFNKPVDIKTESVVVNNHRNSIEDIPDDILDALEKDLDVEEKKPTAPKPAPKTVVITEAPSTTPPKKEPAYKAKIKNLLKDALK